MERQTLFWVKKEKKIEEQMLKGYVYLDKKRESEELNNFYQRLCKVKVVEMFDERKYLTEVSKKQREIFEALKTPLPFIKT